MKNVALILLVMIVGCEVDESQMARYDAERESMRLVGTETTCYEWTEISCGNRSTGWTCVGKYARTPTVSCEHDRCKATFQGEEQ